jgi:hypothetical protein
VVTLRDGGKPETLWPLAAERVADVRAVASESRHLVMVRTEAPPAVYAGWLDERGHSASPLQVVTAGLDAVRDAAVAVRGDEALVVVSAGEPGAERLLASRWSARQAPPPLVALEGEAPSGARGGLAATALPSGWWIQWTARDAAGVRLTGAALASSLQLGPAVEISPPLAALSPVGAVAIGGDVVSVYAVPDGAGRSDVWAAAAACN